MYLRNPAQDMEKQRRVEHDELIHEFEKLTTDPDGLLGVLEDTLNKCSDDPSQQHGDDVTFEARKLLCNLFQVQN